MRSFCLSSLPEFIQAEINRSKIRFSGVGPRLTEENVQNKQSTREAHQNREDRDQSNDEQLVTSTFVTLIDSSSLRRNDDVKLWPRDYYDPKKEYRKIVSPDIFRLIKDDASRCAAIKSMIYECVKSLKKVNLKSLLNRFCGLDIGYFGRLPFSLEKALESYNTYPQIINLIHAALRTISADKNSGIADNLLYIFGSKHNYDIYEEHIVWLVKGNASFREMRICDFIFNKSKPMDLNKVEWLNGLNQEAKYRIFIQVVYFLTRFVAELLRRFFYITVSAPHNGRLFYYRYDIWQKIRDLKIKQAVELGYLVKVNLRGDEEFDEFAVSKIKYHLKKDDYRLICTHSKPSKKCQDKLYISRNIYRYVLEHMPNYEKFSLLQLMKQLRTYRQKIESGELEGVFFVRGDIKDCYQSVDQEKLREIVLKLLKSMFPDNRMRLTHFSYDSIINQNLCRGWKRRWGRIWTFENQEMIEKMLSGKCRNLSETKSETLDIDADFDKEYLENQLMKPLLRLSSDCKQAYLLARGLRQGSHFSSPLSEIYLQALFNEHLDEFYKSRTCRLFRYADDILFMSEDLGEAQRFMRKMLAGFKNDFHLSMNLNKLECNFECRGLIPEYCEFPNNYAIFYKHSIHLNTLEVRYDYSYKSEFHYTYSVNPYMSDGDIEKSLRKLRVAWILLDCKLNGNERVIENIFEKALFFAHRSATSILISFELKNHQKNQRPDLIMRLVDLITKKINKSKEKGVLKDAITNELTYFQIRLLVAAAFCVTWNLNKVRHRLEEQTKIKKLVDRFIMQAQINSFPSAEVSMPINGPVPHHVFEKKLHQLMKDFRNSLFAREVRLPTKNEH